MFRVAGVALVLTMVACGTAQPAATAPAEPDPTPEQSAAPQQPGPQPSQAAVMHDRFDAVSAVQASIVAGEMPMVRDLAGQLASDERLLDVPTEWIPYAESLVQQLQQTATSEDLAIAAVHLSAAARACGDCHSALGVAAIEVDPFESAPSSEDMNGTMRKHRWAADRMWDGLVGPSSESWTAGAAALREAAHHAKQLPEIESDETMSAQLSLVDDIADEAAGAEAPAARQKIYAELLGRCSSCHQDMRAAHD